MCLSSFSSPIRSSISSSSSTEFLARASLFSWTPVSSATSSGTSLSSSSSLLAVVDETCSSIFATFWKVSYKLTFANLKVPNFPQRYCKTARRCRFTWQCPN
uniref:Uncharacterized protein n=1 Tax=Anguilla anguilla TaxID=7936 RepID=A0A0E9WEZ6_ANGAN